MQVFVPTNHALDEVRWAIREHNPDTPVAVISPRLAAERHADQLAHATICSVPLTRAGVVRAAGQAMDAREAPR
jgi:hypothetical protein